MFHEVRGQGKLVAGTPFLKFPCYRGCPDLTGLASSTPQTGGRRKRPILRVFFLQRNMFLDKIWLNRPSLIIRIQRPRNLSFKNCTRDLTPRLKGFTQNCTVQENRPIMYCIVYIVLYCIVLYFCLIQKYYKDLVKDSNSNLSNVID